jgi:hypothetical protein
MGLRLHEYRFRGSNRCFRIIDVGRLVAGIERSQNLIGRDVVPDLDRAADDFARDTECDVRLNASLDFTRQLNFPRKLRPLGRNGADPDKLGLRGLSVRHNRR